MRINTIGIAYAAITTPHKSPKDHPTNGPPGRRLRRRWIGVAAIRRTRPVGQDVPRRAGLGKRARQRDLGSRPRPRLRQARLCGGPQHHLRTPRRRGPPRPLARPRRRTGGRPRRFDHHTKLSRGRRRQRARRQNPDRGDQFRRSGGDGPGREPRPIPAATLPGSRMSPASFRQSVWRSSRRRCQTSERSRCCGTPTIWA